MLNDQKNIQPNEPFITSTAVQSSSTCFCLDPFSSFLFGESDRRRRTSRARYISRHTCDPRHRTAGSMHAGLRVSLGIGAEALHQRFISTPSQTALHTIFVSVLGRFSFGPWGQVPVELRSSKNVRLLTMGGKSLTGCLMHSRFEDVPIPSSAS